MTHAILSTTPAHSEPLAAGTSPGGSAPAGARTASRLIGALFLGGFLSYGMGFALVTSATSSTDFLSTIGAHRTALTLGALLMLVNTAVDVGKAVLFYPILANHSRTTALTYLAAMIVEVTFLSIGVLGLLMTLPLGAHLAAAGEAHTVWAKALGSMVLEWNTLAYQIGEMALGVGAVVLCALLYRTRLIPRTLAGWGVIGYAVLVSGAIAEILGIHISLLLSIPGGLFEVALGVWLVIRGL